jgi:cell division protein FtsW
MVYDSSVAIALRDFSNQYYYLKEQLKWFGIGLFIFFICARIPYQFWYSLALPMLLGTLLLLLIVFFPGVGIRAYGAHRWINFGLFVLQPAELAKLSMIVYLAAWFSHPEKGRFFSFLLFLAMVVGLVMLEPDLGTSMIILCIAMLLYFFSGAPARHFLFLIPILVGGAVILAVIAPYRMQRITTFFNRQSDPLGASYHIRQVLLALGSGGWTGLGIGQSRQKYEYLPEANTDSIFAIIGEETGFLGATFVILFYIFIIWRGFRIAIRAPDPFGRLLALGISSWVAVQTLINLGAMVVVIPLTGVPLPFVSYGGSSFIILLVAMGILLNISKFRTKI